MSWTLIIIGNNNYWIYLIYLKLPTSTIIKKIQRLSRFFQYASACSPTYTIADSNIYWSRFWSCLACSVLFVFSLKACRWYLLFHTTIKMSILEDRLLNL